MIQHVMINLQMQRARRGMTLVDLLLAIGILAVGLSMIATVFPVAAEHTREAVDQSMAVVVARNAEATLRAMATSADYPAYRFTTVDQLNLVINPYRTAGTNMPTDGSVLAENTYFVALPELIPTDIGCRIKDNGLNVFSFRPYVNGSSGAMDTGGQYYWRAVYSRRVTPVYDTNPYGVRSPSGAWTNSRVDLIIMVCKLPDGQTFDKNSRISLSHFNDPVPTWDYEGQGVAVKTGSYMRFAGSAGNRAIFGGLKTGGVWPDSFWYLWYDPNAIYFYRTAIRVVQ